MKTIDEDSYTSAVCEHFGLPSERVVMSSSTLEFGDFGMEVGLRLIITPADLTAIGVILGKQSEAVGGSQP